jgi:RHH-type proline utilization regulon transcriptional repressor/proline dehydrogenase/delta 1-pyrroline-5-carboxylate dehydrogenase
VYDDPSFMVRLAAAVRSLRVLPATDPASMMGPVVSVPSGALRRALTTLEPGEQWLVEPQQLDADGRLWSPGVRIGVQPGSWFHLTECFGPVLGLMRARDLDHAIELQNAPVYGLTGGLHSLDDSEVSHWLERVQVGNAYINRHTTGAVVQRQPFGGWKRSSVGGGAKAGGPGYVRQFARLVEQPGRQAGDLSNRFRSTWSSVFAVEHDPCALDAESNVLRYVSLGRVAVRHDGTRDDLLAIVRAAAGAAGVPLDESDSHTETDEQFAARCATVAPERVRLLTTLGDEARRALHRANVAVVADEPVGHPDAELHHWVREQAVSRTMHRHGRRLDTARGSSR